MTVISKHNDDDQHIWESDAEGKFTVVKDPRGNTLGRGTQIMYGPWHRRAPQRMRIGSLSQKKTHVVKRRLHARPPPHPTPKKNSLHLKDEASSFSDQYQVKELIKKYSEFINFPIYLWMTKKEKVEVPVEDDSDEPAADAEGVTDDDTEDEAEAGGETETVEREVTNAERLNENKPIWTRSPDDLTEQDYIDFYKLFTKDELDPLGFTHFKVGSGGWERERERRREGREQRSRSDTRKPAPSKHFH